MSLRFESFVERSGGNFCWQGPKEWVLWVYEKATKYILLVKLKAFHYLEQKGPLYDIDKKGMTLLSKGQYVDGNSAKNNQITIR